MKPDDLAFVCCTLRIDSRSLVPYAISMKSAAFNQLIADTLTTPVKSVVVYARALKEAGMLTTGCQGGECPGHDGSRRRPHDYRHAVDLEPV